MISDGKDIDSVVAFVRFVGKARFHDLSPDVIDITKRAILDTLGVALAASGIGEGCNEMVAFAMSQAGHAEATIWSNGCRVCASMAALANGALARALDYDDLMDSPQATSNSGRVPSLRTLSSRPRSNLWRRTASDPTTSPRCVPVSGFGGRPCRSRWRNASVRRLRLPR